VWQKRLYSEWFLILVLIFLMVIWCLFAIIVHMISLYSGSDFLDPYCQRICNFCEGTTLKIFVGLLSLVIIIMMGLMLYMLKSKEFYGIRDEFLVILFFGVCSAIGLYVLIIVPNQFWPQEPYVGYIIVVQIFGAFIASVLIPVGITFYQDYVTKKAAQKEAQNILELEETILNEGVQVTEASKKLSLIDPTKPQKISKTSFQSILSHVKGRELF